MDFVNHRGNPKYTPGNILVEIMKSDSHGSINPLVDLMLKPTPPIEKVINNLNILNKNILPCEMRELVNKVMIQYNECKKSQLIGTFIQSKVKINLLKTKLEEQIKINWDYESTKES